MIISPAMLKIFDECPQKYKFMYVDKISLPQNKYFFEKGKKIHAIASYYIKGYDVSKLEKALTEKEKQIWNYLTSTEYFKYELLKSEYQLNMHLGDCWIGGRLDALVKNGNNYYILDYKTGEIPKNPEYDYQTMIYLLCADKKIGDFQSLYFVYLDLKNNTEYKITFTEKLKKEYIQRLSTTLNRLTSVTNYKNNKLQNVKCNCDYYKICSIM